MVDGKLRPLSGPLQSGPPPSQVAPLHTHTHTFICIGGEGDGGGKKPGWPPEPRAPEKMDGSPPGCQFSRLGNCRERASPPLT